MVITRTLSGTPNPFRTPGAGAGNPPGGPRTGVFTATVGTGSVVTIPTPTRTPVPTPTSVAAQFFITPTPVPTVPPAPPPPPLPGRIVYQVSSGGSINVVNADGTGLRTVVQGGLDPAWSPDGKQIAFTRWGADSVRGLWVVNEDGSGLRRLQVFDDPKSPWWSGDGSKIVVTTRTSGGSRRGRTAWRLDGVRVADGALLSIPEDAEWFAFTPTWSSRGPIVYLGNKGLYVTSEDGQADVLWETTRADSPAWSPDGSRLAFMLNQNGQWDIMVMNPDGSGMANLTPAAPFLKRVPNDVAPAWSPDGKYIAFLSDEEREDYWGIYVMRADGTGRRRLLDVPVRYEFASERVLSWAR